MKRKIILNSFGFPIDSLTGELIAGDYSYSELISPEALGSNISATKDDEKELTDIQLRPITRTKANKEEEEEEEGEVKNIVETKRTKLNYSNQCSEYNESIGSSNIDLSQKKKESFIKNSTTDDFKAHDIFDHKDEGLNLKIDSRNINEKANQHSNKKNTKKKSISDKKVSKGSSEKKSKSKPLKQLTPLEDIGSNQIETTKDESYLIKINEIKDKLSKSLIQADPSNANYLSSIYNRTKQFLVDSLDFINHKKFFQSLNQNSRNENITGLYLFIYLHKHILYLAQQQDNKFQLSSDPWDSKTIPIPDLHSKSIEPPSSIKQLTKREIDGLLQQNKFYSNFLFILGKYNQTKNDLLLKVVLEKEGIVVEANQNAFSKVLYSTDYFNIVILYSAKNGYSHQIDYLNMKN